MSQKVTLKQCDTRYLPQIKTMLIEGKNQIEISQALRLRRETINRKLQRWMKTEDFNEWLKEVWIDLYREVKNKDNIEAFKQVTRLLSNVLGKQPLLTDDIHELIVKWEWNEPNPNDFIRTTSRAETVPPKQSQE